MATRLSIAINLLLLLLATSSTQKATAASVVHYNISTTLWDWEFKKNKWAFIDKVAVERGRNSIIGGVFYPLYGGGGSVPSRLLLDVGCGEAVLSDFLTPQQKPSYVGIDISTEAIKIARKKRAAASESSTSQAQAQAQAGTASSTSSNNAVNPANLHVSPALGFKPPPGITYGAIVFNEMLYYTNYTQVLEHYIPFLELPSGVAQGGPVMGQEGGIAGGQGGVIIISCWYTLTNAHMKDGIFQEARRLLEPVDSMELQGFSVELKGKKGVARRQVWFHIEALRARRP